MPADAPPTETPSDAAAGVEEIVQRIRPAVRREHPYVVGAPPTAEVKLNQNENPYGLPPEVKDELAERLREISFNRYPAEQPDRLTRALAAHLDHDPDGLIIGNGSNELTYTLGLTLIEDGAPVVMPRPMFALYAKVARMSGADLTEVPPRDDLQFDTEALLRAIQREQPALVVLTSPNNPTGRALPFEEIRALVQAAPGAVVVDEAYVEFNDEPSALTLLEEHPNVIVLRTFSKAWGLAGLRLGYLAMRPALAREMMKARVPFMINRFNEAVALSLLRRPALREERVETLRQSTAELREGLQNTDGVEAMPSQANFIIFRPEKAGAQALLDRLAEESVLVRDMGGYPALEGCLRVCAGTPEENKAFLAALKKSLSKIEQV